jgi:hypothetical protein
MAEQIPEAWIGQEVTVYYGPGGNFIRARWRRYRSGVSSCALSREIRMSASPGIPSPL